ncbi:hypothetical protein [Bacillus sp. 1P06AnD]|uniref:hypothetical protein n=1 Tax=Bacillus sp. 1P06AnD TaxID=3132208 RepID=UPI0039A0BD78
MNDSQIRANLNRFFRDVIGCSKVLNNVGAMDMVAITGPIYCIVQITKTINQQIIDKAIQHQQKGQYVFIAVNSKNEIPDKYFSNLKKHGIGLLLLVEGEVNLYLPAKYNPAKGNNDLLELMRFS